MGCLGGRKEVEPRPEQKWDAISLRDFNSSSPWTMLAYGYLHFDILLSFAIYGVDTFTAINLLAFNTWSGSIKPDQLISFDIAKWIFSACIIASFVNVGYEHLRSLRVRKRGNVAECYLDNLAVRMESTRWGKGQGWKRFLVFAELTKSKKGAEYIALFTYFSLQAWIRVIICSGPRQVINAFTLKAVYDSNLIPNDVSTVESTFESFFAKIRTLYNENNQQAIILSGMLFTLVIWIFSVLFMLIGVLFYVFYLWSYIPKEDGGLRNHCERKINKRLMRIVMTKVTDAIARDEYKARKAEYKAAAKAGEKPLPERQATLPQLMMNPDDPEKLPEMPMPYRNDTMVTLPMYSSRPGTPSTEYNSFEPPRLLQRQGTNTTTSSASSRFPLVGGAAAMGYERSASPAPSLPWNNLPPQRPESAASHRTYRTAPSVSRLNTNIHPFGGPVARTESPAILSPSDSLPAMPEPLRSPTGRPMPRPVNNVPNWPGPVPNGTGFTPYAPQRSATNPLTSPLRQEFNPPRNITAPVPMQHPGHFISRPGTAASHRGYGPDADVEAQRRYNGY
jgi:hypothetical protein